MFFGHILTAKWMIELNRCFFKLTFQCNYNYIIKFEGSEMVRGIIEEFVELFYSNNNSSSGLNYLQNIAKDSLSICIDINISQPTSAEATLGPSSFGP